MDIHDDDFYGLVCDPLRLFNHFLGFPAAYFQRYFDVSESSCALMRDFLWRGEAAFYGNKALRHWVRCYKSVVQSEIQMNFLSNFISLTAPKSHFDTTKPDHTTMQAVTHQEAELQVERLLAFVQALRALLETFVDKQTSLPDRYPRPKDEYFEPPVADPTTREGTEYLLTGNPFPDLTAE